MRILIDALSARHGGGITYMHYLPQALAATDTENEYMVLVSSCYQQRIIKALPTSWKIIDVSLSEEAFLNRWWYLQTKLPSLVRQYEIDILFTVIEMASLTVPCKKVVLVRNFSFYAPLNLYATLNQKLFIFFYRLTREPLVYLSLLRADRVLFVSSELRYFIQRHLPLPKHKQTAVLYHGLGNEFRYTFHKDWDDLKHNYSLAVSSIMPHKNYELLIRAYAHFASDSAHLTHELLIAGHAEDQKLYHKLCLLVDELNLNNRVRFLGNVTHSELILLYQKARIFVFPSKLETFGHPLVEAMSSGVPVLASDLPICHEICQSAALYFSSINTTELAISWRRVLEDTALQETMIRRGLERASCFSWDRTAKLLVENFRQVTAKI
ncbi:MAG: glycosyltransferase family 1 protein [Caldilineaceae bacterium]